MGPVSVRHCHALPKLHDIKTFHDVLTAEEAERLVEAVANPRPRYARLRTNGRYRALGCLLRPGDGRAQEQLRSTDRLLRERASSS